MPEVTSHGRAQRPFNISRCLRRIREAVRCFPKAAMFDLAERGHASAFEQLVACIISIRTRDETSLPIALRLFERAPTPARMAALGAGGIEELIRRSTFHEPKSRQIHAIACRVRDEFGGDLPCDEETLLSFHGVGPKCAHLVLGIAGSQPAISVDVHVHRVVNRWGYVQANAPEKTMAALATRLPKRYWVEINALLVPFGKHICTPQAPRCSTCVVRDMCRRVGVTSHR